jgi:hypothetical protein
MPVATSVLRSAPRTKFSVKFPRAHNQPHIDSVIHRVLSVL